MEYSVIFNESVVRNASYYHWRRLVGLHTIVLTILLFIGSLAFFISGDRSWYIGLFLGISGLAFFIFVSGYYFLVRRGLKKLSSMEENRVIYRINDDSFYASSSLGTTEICWKMINEIYRKQDIWLIYFNKCQFITLPVQSISQEGRDLLCKYVSESGGKII